MADDNSQNLQIHIISDADTKGFKEASAAGNKLKIDTSDLSDETKRQLGLLPQLEDGLKKGGKAAEETGLSHRELKRVLLDIGNVAAPGAGRALMELAMGPVGIGLALVSVYEMLKKTLEDDEAAADKLAELMAKPENGGIMAVKEAWDKAAESLGKYHAAMATAGEDNDPVATQIKRAKELADAQVEASKKIVSALGEQTVARLRENGATKEQIATAEANIKSQLAALDQLKEHATGSGALQSELTQRKSQSGKLDQAALDADAHNKAVGLKFTQDQATLESARDALGMGKEGPNSEAAKALKKKQEDAAAKLEAAQNIPDTTVSVAGGSAVVVDNSAMKQKAIEEAQGEVEKANAEVAARKKEVAQLEASEAQRAKEKELADEAAKRAKEASEKNQARLRELPEEIDQAHKVETTKDHAQSVIDVLNTHGGKSNAALGEVATAIGLTEQQRLNIAERILKHQMTIQQAWAGLEQRLAQLEAQGKHVTFNGR
jgi:hypothetical protein